MIINPIIGRSPCQTSTLALQQQPVQFSIDAANNNYAGFGPGTVNIFRQLLGLEEVKWGDEIVATNDLEKEKVVSKNKHVVKSKQTSLPDFFI